MTTRLWRSLSAARGARYAVIMLFCASIGLTGASYALTVGAIHRAERAAASTTQLCLAGNTARAQQVGLWEYIISIGQPPPHETAAQRARRARTIHVFLTHLHKVFAPRNCAHPSRTEPTP